jgi:hypothetical protein
MQERHATVSVGIGRPMLGAQLGATAQATARARGHAEGTFDADGLARPAGLAPAVEARSDDALKVLGRHRDPFGVQPHSSKRCKYSRASHRGSSALSRANRGASLSPAPPSRHR